MDQTERKRRLQNLIDGALRRYHMEAQRENYPTAIIEDLSYLIKESSKRVKALAPVYEDEDEIFESDEADDHYGSRPGEGKF